VRKGVTVDKATDGARAAAPTPPPESIRSSLIESSVMNKKRQLKLGVSMRYLGYHDGAWRHPDVPPGGASDFQYFLNSARIAERGKFDMVFFADGIGIRANDEPPGSLCRNNQNAELEPLTLLSALAPMTKNIGLVTTASTTYNEPFHIARKFGSLDHISGGRAGWNIVTSWSEQEAWNFNREAHMEYDARYERAQEFVEVVTGLWDSWEEDSFIHDKKSGIFYDETKLHVLNHKGKHFSVRGPLSVKRTPQGRPVLVQAGESEQGRDIAASVGEVVYAVKDNIPAAREYYDDLKRRLTGYGRSEEDLKIMPALVPIVGRTMQEAQDKFEQLQALVDPLVGLARLSTQMGDLSGFPLDGPVPDPPNPRVRSLAQTMVARARRENMTLRQLYQSVSSARGIRVIGTASQVADVMEEWIEKRAADGFNVTPTHLPGGLLDFVDMVVPELQRRGIFRTEYEGTTLRENLGLPWPENRYQRARTRALRTTSGAR
jgi:FMN-dependent oxidoreductase (nitrilotriacetate monooxygenase family)